MAATVRQNDGKRRQAHRVRDKQSLREDFVCRINIKTAHEGWHRCSVAGAAWLAISADPEKLRHVAIALSDQRLEQGIKVWRKGFDCLR